MTGYKSKKDAALNEDGMYLVHQTAQPKQEPVAWTVVGDGKFGKYEIGQETESNLDASSYWVNRGYNLLPLYTTPPQRPWIGLTDEDCKGMSAGDRVVAMWANRILKEKNS